MKRSFVQGRGRLSPWRLLAALVFAASAALLTRDAWMNIIQRALRDQECSYVFIGLCVSIWLVWVRRERLRFCSFRESWMGLALLVAGSVLYVTGYWRNVHFYWHAGAVLTVVGSALAVMGGGILPRFLPSFCVLIFLMPISPYWRHYFAFPMQGITARMTENACEVLGIQVDRSGNLLSINGTNVAIAEACNGMRMVITLFLACCTIAFSMPLRSYVRVLLLVLSPLVAIAFNVFRMVPTVWFYGNTSLATANVFHELSGWVMLVLAFLTLVLLFKLLNWARLPIVRYALATG